MSAERAQHYRKPIVPKGLPIEEVYHTKRTTLATLTPTTLAPAEELHERMPDMYTAGGPLTVSLN